MSDLILPQYGTLLTELKARIHAAQYAALRAVNKELTLCIGISAKRLMNGKLPKAGVKV